MIHAATDVSPFSLEYKTVLKNVINVVLLLKGQRANMATEHTDEEVHSVQSEVKK